MAESKLKHDWRMTASIRASIANGELRRRNKQPWTADDFDPYSDKHSDKSSKMPLDKKGLNFLRRMLLDRF